MNGPLNRGWLRRLLPAAVLATGLARAVAACAGEIVVRLPGESVPAHRQQQKTLTLRIEDVEGTYTIPFIQSGRELHVRINFTDPAVVAADVRLVQNDQVVSEQRATRNQPSVGFPKLNPGEYALQCVGLDHKSQEQCRVTYSRVGIGSVIAALGDSITEGYIGHGFKQQDLNLTSDRFPPESVSHDGRNFPQFAPNASRHLPSINCFESWMTLLNNSLTSAWRGPVFIANEGWGGITTAGYLTMMREDAGWKKRILQLEPQLWLIHLGVNDERAGVVATVVRANLAAMVDELIKNYQAKPAHIFLCRPSYDYHPGAATLLQSYSEAIDGLIKEHGLSQGPDFFAAFSRDKERWYGEDPVHPNLEGTTHMAMLWHEALVRQLPSGPPSHK
jgi:lysophospholipase L1-like esterase